MPRPCPIVLPMTIDEFRRMEHRLGWKHEYWDGAARLSVQETAVASFQQNVTSPVGGRPTVGDGEQLRPVRDNDQGALVELFQRAFDDAIEFAGWPDDAYQRDARDSIASFFGNSTEGQRRPSGNGRTDASFVVTAGERLLAAVMVRSIRRGPILEPIMVLPAHQRRGLGSKLLAAALDALHSAGEATLFTRCHLGNAASLAWHERNGFEEIPSYFAATHRWRHFGWLVEHYEDTGDLQRAADMRTLCEHWKVVVEKLEASGDRWSSGLLD